MLQRTIRRLAIAAALLSLLSLSSPVQAAGWGPAVTRGDFFAGAIQWVAGFLGKPAQTGKAPRRVKAGMGIDPDGAPNLVTPTPSETNCTKCNGDSQSH
jgi:hypothetical protein